MHRLTVDRWRDAQTDSRQMVRRSRVNLHITTKNIMLSFLNDNQHKNDFILILTQMCMHFCKTRQFYIKREYYT